MPPKASANAQRALGLTEDGEKGFFEVIEVGAPLAGLYDLGQPFALPPEALARSTNNVFNSLALEKRKGNARIGNGLSFLRCEWGGQYQMTYPVSPPNAHPTHFRVNGGRLYRLVDSTAAPATWTWVGAASGVADPGTSADDISSSGLLGTAVVRANKLFYASGGTMRKVFLLTGTNAIVDWGSNVTPTAGTIDTEAAVGGFLLSNRRYSFRYQYINTVTGFKTPYAPASNVWLTTNVGDTVLLNITIPAVAGLDATWSILRIARSPGAVDPAVPAEWKFEKDLTGQNPAAPVVTTLTIPDGNLGADSIVDVYPVAPRARYLLYDPNADRLILFGDPTAPNVVYWTEAGNYGNIPPVNQTPPVDDNNLDPLTGGFSGLNGTIYLMKQGAGIYELASTIAGGYAPRKITNAAGCISFHSIVCRGSALYWLSTEGAIEFLGQEPVNISDDRIRRLMAELMASTTTVSRTVNCYGMEVRRPGVAAIDWIVPVPGQLDRSYHIRYDLNLRAWTFLDYTGTDKAQWMVYDGDAGYNDARPFTNTYENFVGDVDGSVYKLERNGVCEPVYSDASVFGGNYLWDVRTPWFGNGIDTYIPRYFDFLLGVVPVGLSSGTVRVSLYTDGDETERHFKEFVLRDTTDPKNGKKLYVRERFRMNAEVSRCTMFQIGLKHSVTNGAPVVPWYRILYKIDPCPPRGASD